MKKIGIIGAMDSEVALFREEFSAAETNVSGIYRGTDGKNELYICRSGVGKVNAAIAAQKMIDLFGVEEIINSGVAGGIAPGIEKNDAVISESLTYHDLTPADIMENYPPYCRYIPADKELIEKALRACEKLNADLEKAGKPTFKARVGVIVSGDCFVSSSEKAQSLYREHKALCTEMEGAAIAHVAHAAGIPFLVLRTVSDFADEEAEGSFETFEHIAAQRAAYIVKEILA